MTDSTQQIPGIPPPPPKLNTRRLWITLLLPPGFLCAIYAGFAAVRPSGQVASDVFITFVGILIVATLVCWFVFYETINQRFRGPSLVFLTIAYPFTQTILLFSISLLAAIALVSVLNFF